MRTSIGAAGVRHSTTAGWYGRRRCRSPKPRPRSTAPTRTLPGAWAAIHGWPRRRVRSPWGSSAGWSSARRSSARWVSIRARGSLPPTNCARCAPSSTWSQHNRASSVSTASGPRRRSSTSSSGGRSLPQSCDDPPAAMPLRVGSVEHLVAQRYGSDPAAIRRAGWQNFAQLVERSGTGALLPAAFRAMLVNPCRRPGQSRAQTTSFARRQARTAQAMVAPDRLTKISKPA